MKQAYENLNKSKKMFEEETVHLQSIVKYWKGEYESIKSRYQTLKKDNDALLVSEKATPPAPQYMSLNLDNQKDLAVKRIKRLLMSKCKWETKLIFEKWKSKGVLKLTSQELVDSKISLRLENKSLKKELEKIKVGKVDKDV